MKRLLRWDVEIYCVDHWKVYPKEMPAGCRYLQSKAETVALERNNSRQRHWFARFRRKSIVVSKSKEMVDLTNHGSTCQISCKWQYDEVVIIT